MLQLVNDLSAGSAFPMTKVMYGSTLDIIVGGFDILKCPRHAQVDSHSILCCKSCITVLSLFGFASNPPNF